MDDDKDIVSVERTYKYPEAAYIVMNEPGEKRVKKFLGFAKDIVEEDGVKKEEEENVAPNNKKDEKPTVVKKKTSVKMKNKPICRYCAKVPCLLDRNYDRINEAGHELEAHGEYSNKELRYACYAAAASGIWGRLGAGNRRKLPECVVQYIHDCYPEPNRSHYVGFRANGSMGFDSYNEE